jgi:flagellar operon protein
MRLENQGFLSLEQVQNQYLTNDRKYFPGSVQEENSFGKALEEAYQKADIKKESEIRFSKHAANRLSDRNITLSADQMDRLKEGAQKASSKGIQESLVLVDQLAFIVNVPSGTVVTAMDQTENKSNVFTNIDGAVIA